MTPEDTARVVEACRDERTRHWLAELPSPYDEKAAADFIAGRTLPLATGKGLSWTVATRSRACCWARSVSST